MTPVPHRFALLLDLSTLVIGGCDDHVRPDPDPVVIRRVEVSRTGAGGG